MKTNNFFAMWYQIRKTISFSYIIQLTRNLPLLLCFSLNPYSGVQQAQAEGIGWTCIIDDGDSGYSETGNAWVSRAWGSAYNGDYRYLSHLGHTTERKGTATWQITIPTSGTYRVDIHYRPTENRTNDADFNVYDGRGVLHKHSINQTYNGPLSRTGWYTLGEYDWNTGHRAKVVLDGTDDTDSDEADAVRWVLVKRSTGGPLSDVGTIVILSKLLLSGNTSASTPINLQGSWMETGGYGHCPSEKTALAVKFNYDTIGYKIEKIGILQDEKCHLLSIQSYNKQLSMSERSVTVGEFTRLMENIYTRAKRISVSTFSQNRIRYTVFHQTERTQTRTMSR